VDNGKVREYDRIGRIRGLVFFTEAVEALFNDLLA
jgi:hypothetical protein